MARYFSRASGLLSSKSLAHEDNTRTHSVEMGSNRSFGLVFTIALALLGLWPVFKKGTPLYWALAVAAALLAITVARPTLLAPLNKIWFRIGLLLSAIVNPIVMGVIYYVVVTPTGMVMRGLGKNPLTLKFDKSAETYWVNRDPPGPSPDTMNHQF